MEKIALIKELRERTNGGMVDCKNALEASNWDIDKAITWLKSNGKIKAAKKAGRISAEGILAIAGDEKKAIMIELNCETDFVAKNEKFQKAGDDIAKALLASKAKNEKDALKVKVDKDTVEELTEHLTATIGEKTSFRRFTIVEAKKDEVLGVFLHINRQIASIVTVKGNDKESARNVAMHMAAMNPEFVFAKDLPKVRVEKFKAEFAIPANFDKKPEKVQEMIRENSLNKKISEVTLEKQAFMMDESLSIEKYLANHKGTLVAAVRYGVGEGLEKRQDDFAAEVASQMKK